MVKTIKEERLKWVLPIVKKEAKLIEVTKGCPHSKRSLERWVATYKEKGEAGLEPKSTEPKTPSETVSQKSAVRKAKSYLNYTAFSRDGLVEQLKFDGFTQAQAEHGADAIGL